MKKFLFLIALIPSFSFADISLVGSGSGGGLTVAAPAASGGSGGASSLEVFNNNDGTRSSPTASISLNNAFRGTVTGSTYTFSLNSSSVTLLGPNVAALLSTQTWSGRNTFTSTQSIRLVPVGGTGSTAGTSGAYLLDCTNAFNGICEQIYRNDTNTQGQASALLFLMNDATSYNTNMLWIKSDSTSTIGGNADINVHANNPDIEFRELDKYNAGSGIGQWEIAVNNDNLQMNFRNAGDTSFQVLNDFDRDSGFRFKELDNGADYSAFRSTTTMPGYSLSYVLPSDVPATGDSLRILGTSGGSFNLDWSPIPGGAAALAIGTGTASNFTTSVTSPTAAISFLGSQFISQSVGTTNFISLVPQASGVSVYNATSTAGFPFGFSASTAVIPSILGATAFNSAVTIGNTGGTNALVVRGSGSSFSAAPVMAVFDNANSAPFNAGYLEFQNAGTTAGYLLFANNILRFYSADRSQNAGYFFNGSVVALNLGSSNLVEVSGGNIAVQSGGNPRDINVRLTKYLDSDQSNFVTIGSSAAVTADYGLVLPISSVGASAGSSVRVASVSGTAVSLEFGGVIVGTTSTPTLTNVANVAASTAYKGQYMRTGETVTFSFKVDIDPTLAATSTQLGVSIPVASNFTADNNASGTCFASGIAGLGAAVLADATNDRLQVQYISSDVTNQPMYCTATYVVQ